MKVRKDVPISELTTMRIGGKARLVYELEKPSDLIKAIQDAEEHGLPIWMMGSGANTIGHDEGFDGIILLNMMRGMTILEQTPEKLKVQAMGGEIWDDLVAFCCDLGYSGIETMSMIPGTVGAAPVQNIGAYGQDVAQTLENVEAFDLQTKKFVTLDKSEMHLTYRSTRFNHGDDAGRFLIVAATLVLQKQNLKPPFYNSLQHYIDEHKVTDFSPHNIRKIVCEIRTDKLPDPKFVASAGSFFKNVIVSPNDVDATLARGIPVWKNPDGSGKINAGCLIEQCGLRGKSFDGFKVSDKAALVLINENAKSYADLAKARQKIIDAVQTKFGFELQQEPVEIPASKE